MSAGFASLDGKIALVTGGSRGIGKAIALELGRAGANVVLSYRTGRDEAQQVAAEIAGRAVEADVSDAASAKALVEEAGDLDILVNNAGLTRDGVLARMSDDDWRAVIDTNLSSVFYTCRAAARPMMKSATNQRGKDGRSGVAAGVSRAPLSTLARNANQSAYRNASHTTEASHVDFNGHRTTAIPLADQSTLASVTARRSVARALSRQPSASRSANALNPATLSP